MSHTVSDTHALSERYLSLCCTPTFLQRLGTWLALGLPVARGEHGSI